MKILVTGGSGNVGSAVVAELKRAELDVRILDLKEPRTEGMDFVHGSVTDPAIVEAAMDGIDAVVHLAAIPSFRPEIPAVEYMNVNVTGTFNVLEAAGKRGVKKTVLASSDSALGFVFSTHPFSPEYLPLDERHPLRPQDPYGLSKLLGEELCKSASRKYGMETICLRFCWVWFADTFPQRAAILGGDPKTLAKTMWGYVDVRDAAQACRRAIECPTPIFGDAFFITAEDTYADAPSLDLIQTHYPEVRNVRNGYFAKKYRSLFDTEKARKILGYAPQYSCR